MNPCTRGPLGQSSKITHSLQWPSMMLLADSPKYRPVADTTANTITLGSTYKFFLQRKDKWFTLSKW